MSCWGDRLPKLIGDFKQIEAGFDPRYVNLNQNPGLNTKLISIEMRPMEKWRFEVWNSMSLRDRPSDPWDIASDTSVNGYKNMITFVKFIWVLPDGEKIYTTDIWDNEHCMDDWKMAKNIILEHTKK